MDAIQKFRRVSKLFPGYEDTRDKLAGAEDRAAEIFYKQGVKLSKEEDWRMAVQAFKAVIDINPNYYDTQKLFKNARANNSADYFINKGEESIRSRNWERAIFLYEKALEYEPDNEQLINRLKALKLKGGEAHFDKAMKFSSQRKLNRAVEELLKASKYSPSLVDSRFYKEFIKSLCQKLDQRSDVYIELRKWGNALVWLQKLDSIDPDYKGLFHKLQVVKDKIKNRIKKSIAVFDFSSPTENKDAGKIIASKLVTFLSKNASGDLKIIERENLQSILKEMQLGQTGLVDMDTAKRVGKMRGIDTFILGDVLHFSSKSKNYPSTNTVRVQIDTRTEDNPAFERWRMVHPKPTEEEMKKAPPMKIEKPVYRLYTYETGTTKIISFIEIAYKLVNTMTGENIFTNTISGKLSKKDDYHHGLPAANIKQDPLELPTEVEVLDDLTNQNISDVGLSVLKHFQSLELVYFNEGERQFKRRKYEEAIERYTDAIFDEKIKGISSPISKKSSEMIARLSQNM
jgi:tetratricopeptide (TPR) repeat protein